MAHQDIHIRSLPPERAADLYRTADTPEAAAELLRARGRFGMALMVSTLRSSPARGTAALFRDWAAAGIVGDGWYEPGTERALQPPEARRKILAAFTWLGDVFERYAAKQVPIPVDTTPTDMLSASDEQTYTKTRRNKKRSGTYAGKARRSRAR